MTKHHTYMHSSNSTRGEYIDKVYRYLKTLQPGQKVRIDKVSTNPPYFIEAVKFIIDLRTIEVEFSNDYKYIIKKEEVNYEHYSKQQHLGSSRRKRRGSPIHESDRTEETRHD